MRWATLCLSYNYGTEVLEMSICLLNFIELVSVALDLNLVLLLQSLQILTIA